MPEWFLLAGQRDFPVEHKYKKRKQKSCLIESVCIIYPTIYVPCSVFKYLSNFHSASLFFVLPANEQRRWIQYRNTTTKYTRILQQNEKKNSGAQRVNKTLRCARNFSSSLRGTPCDPCDKGDKRVARTDSSNRGKHNGECKIAAGHSHIHSFTGLRAVCSCVFIVFRGRKQKQQARRTPSPGM